MTLLDDVPVGARVGLDTSLFIYFVEDHPTFKPIVRPLIVDRLNQQLNEGVTSVVSLAESLVQPLVRGRGDLLQAYRDLLRGHPSITLVPITPDLGERAADLRARFRLRLPDACQIAAALQEGASLFITNDIQLRRVTDLTVLILQDYLPPSTP